jgi:hypothetical protein
VIGQHEKVYKRYLNLFGRLQDPVLQSRVPPLLKLKPGLRGTCCRYYASLGFSRARLAHFEEFLRSGMCVDDSTPFEIVRTIISWDVPRSPILRNAIVQLAHDGFLRDHEATIAGLTCSVWLLAKYGTSEEIHAFITNAEKHWKRSHWLARQIAAVVPRLDDSALAAVSRSISSSGVIEGLRVMSSLNELRECRYLDNQLHFYLMHEPKPGQSYPLNKVILLLWLQRGALPEQVRRELTAGVLKFVTDRTYRTLLRAARSVERAAPRAQ